MNWGNGLIIAAGEKSQYQATTAQEAGDKSMSCGFTQSFA